MGVSEAVLSESIGREANDILATGLAQLLTMIRTILIYALALSKKLIQFLGTHPLASLLLIENMAILIS